ncbi:MAG TPA: ABC transporter ATP-binding protein [Trebonia sp.]|nr:ABC transporter ATP-binding protein [Trebonia sp.]
MTVVTAERAAEPPASSRPPLVEVRGLRVRFWGRHTDPVVGGISFTLNRGECLALVGESGSGKSVTARTLVGLTGAGARVEAERLRFGGQDLTRFPARTWRQVRGGRIGFVMQDALSSLDSLRPVGREIAEPLRLHLPLTRPQRDQRVLELLTAVGVPEPEFRAGQYPHELSGGLRQRALIASAIACAPELLIADEPTTALDATIGKQVIELLGSLKTGDSGLLIISHDLSVVASLADRVAVMRAGQIVEQGPTSEVLRSPAHDYTKALLAAVPSAASKGTRLSYAQAALGIPRASPTPGPRPVAGVTEAVGGPVVAARKLVKAFTGQDNVSRTAVADVSFELFAGETLGIVGESGSGKTTTARIVVGLEKPDAGGVLLRGRDWATLDAAGRQAARKRVQYVYQDPLSSFDPRYTVERVIAEALRVAGARGAAGRERMSRLLELVALDDSFRARRPIELSGGQRQRVAIARALATDPEVLVLDEPVSALDVSVQARILDLLADLQERLGVAYLFISHDLGVIHHMCDRVLVMKDGAVVESGDVEDVFRNPRQDYTRTLLDAIPRLSAGADAPRAEAEGAGHA